MATGAWVSCTHSAAGWVGPIDGQAVAGCAAVWVGDGGAGWVLRGGGGSFCRLENVELPIVLSGVSYIHSAKILALRHL